MRITRPFYLGKHLVTQEQWEAVMGNNPSHFKGPKNPVEQVSWDDCQASLTKLNAKVRPGGKFALPTEAQWEYACRAGSTTRYCFGDEESRLGEYAWYGANSGSKTHPVGEKKPNAWGLHDMHGNVWEWCQDWYDGGYYANSPTDDPMGPATGSLRVYRGGCWLDSGGRLGSAGAGRACNALPGGCGIFLGLRVARVPAEAGAEPRLPVLAAAAEDPTHPPADRRGGKAAECCRCPSRTPSLEGKVRYNLAVNAAGRREDRPTVGRVLLDASAGTCSPASTRDGISRRRGRAEGPDDFSIIVTRPCDAADTRSRRKEIAVDLGNGVKLEMVLIPAGEFLMGSPDSDKDAAGDEKPQHRVRITKPFYLGKYLVTQEQWEAVMGNNPSNFKGPKNPVEQVSWDDCQQFLEKLNAKSGPRDGKFQLPTEAQWEYACRAGSTTRYCFGDDESKLGEYAWYDANSGTRRILWARRSRTPGAV